MLGAFVISAVLGASPCPHTWFPIEEGLELTYRAGKQEIPVHFSAVTEKKDAVTGVIGMTLKGRDGKTEAKCTADGITTGAGGLEGLALNSSGMDVEIVKTEGVILPPPDQLTQGAKWTNSITMKMRPPKTMQLGGGIKGALASSLVITTTIKKESTVVGPDHVVTAAGEFDGLKISNKTTASAGDGGTALRTVESTMWLAPRVGIVKIMTGDSVDFELLKVERNKTASAK